MALKNDDFVLKKFPLFCNSRYTRNETFARKTVYPLVSGLVSWWSCFLQRSTGADGKLLLEDWNPTDPDASHEGQPVKNPMIGIAFAKRFASVQIELVKALGMPAGSDADAVEIMNSLVDFPLAKQGDPALNGSSGKPWVGWSDATVKASDMFALYPVWPTEFVSRASDAIVLDTTRRSSKVYSHFASGRPVEIFPAAVRAGFSSKDGTGWKPEEVLDGLAVSLLHLGCCDTNMLPYAPGGGVENVGVSRAVNEMLVVAPEGLFIELFPFWPAQETASFSTLRTKGGWLVSASKASGVVSGVTIEATVPGTVRLVDPWAGAAEAAATIACSPAPASPPVPITSAGGQQGLLTWTMSVGQGCKVSNK